MPETPDVLTRLADLRIYAARHDWPLWTKAVIEDAHAEIERLRREEAAVNEALDGVKAMADELLADLQKLRGEHD